MKVRIALIAALLSIQPVFADMSMMGGDKDCGAIADACKSAGFDRDQTGGKNIWMDCMKPVMMGHSVKDVKIDEKTAKACKATKIKEMKEELKELQK